jgi:hypothetical protein
MLGPFLGPLRTPRGCPVDHESQIRRLAMTIKDR